MHGAMLIGAVIVCIALSTVALRLTLRVRAAPLCRSMAAVVLLVLGSAAAEAESVPLPREKPHTAGEAEVGAGGADGADEDEIGALPGSCLQALEDSGVTGERAAGFVDRGQCIVEDPVSVEAVDTRAGMVRLPARPVLACRFAANLGAWLSEVVSPVAATILGSPVDAIITGPGYQCRRRGDGRISQHATGNAVDIAEIRLADGRSIPVARLAEAAGAEQEFLRGISASACGYFTTVLGPGSDPAHAGHLHVDLAERTIPEFRICMLR